MAAADELKDSFAGLTDDEKIAFVKPVVPFLCETFRREPYKMIEEMKPLCREMVKESKVDIFDMLRIPWDEGGNRPPAYQVSEYP